MRGGIAAVVLVLLSACTSGAEPSPGLHVANGTPLTVTLVVNGQRVADFPAWGPEPSIDVATLPPLPWTVEARSPSGRVLASMHVEPGQVSSSGNSFTGVMGRVDLSCGRLTIWAGDAPPLGPAPDPAAGTPNDCAP